jgi:hypothetical protein
MNSHFISDELYQSLESMTTEHLVECALAMRDAWLKNPKDGDSLLSAMIFAEVLREKGVSLPMLEENEEINAALNHFIDQSAR